MKISGSNPAELTSPFRPIQPAPVTSIRSSSSSSATSVHASVSLPIYVFDCPLSNLIQELLARECDARKEDLFKDHTFRDQESTGSRASGTDEGEEVQPPGPLNRDDDGGARSQPTPESAANDASTSSNVAGNDPRKELTQYCSVVEAVYCRALGQALFTSLQQGTTIHSRDVQAAMDLCKETLLEVDITSFIQNICGHVKDFKMKSGIEMLRQQQLRKQQDVPAEQPEQQQMVDTDKWQFPMSLLRLHQPCASLKHLHKLIRSRFEETLCLSFKPVPSQRDYYFYCPPDCQLIPGPAADELDVTEVSMSHDDHDQVVEFCRSQHDMDSGSTDATSVSSNDNSSRPMNDIDLEVDDDEEEEDEVDDDKEEIQIPLFLHLTATIRCNKQIVSQSINSLPTCLGNLLTSWPSKLNAPRKVRNI